MPTRKEIYFNNIIKKFKDKNKEEEDRYASFDYCYNYFKNSSADELAQDKEKSCLVLGFYLASWGMLRGSSFLLEKSLKYYLQIIEYIIERKQINPEYWELGNYKNIDDKKIEDIIKIYYDIEKILGNASKNKNYSTLITKIMLGVFACIPAFDTNFVKTFDILYKNSFNNTNSSKITKEKLKECLEKIRCFYEHNNSCVDNTNIYTKSFYKMEFTEIKPRKYVCLNVNKIPNKYSSAKVVDMFGFIVGEEILNLEKEKKEKEKKEKEKREKRKDNKKSNKKNKHNKNNNTNIKYIEKRIMKEKRKIKKIFLN
ncbi:hypothetical protein [Arcobacter vandammei]|uniref:hypothetical protein n=1 Tax=Arcobacter vandammei TaxID=2782243 RepID=UPI0018E04922|nr:hypothetical protein [Arcobacter vandammei]